MKFNKKNYSSLFTYFTPKSSTNRVNLIGIFCGAIGLVLFWMGSNQMGIYFLSGLGWISNLIVWVHRLIPFFPHMHIISCLSTVWHNIIPWILVVSCLDVFSCTRVMLIWCWGTCCLCQIIQPLLLDLIWHCSQVFWFLLILAFLYTFPRRVLIYYILQ